MAITELQAIALKSRNDDPHRSQALQHRAGDGAERRVFVERRKGGTGKLGNRRSDNWMPYSTTFVAQLLGQQLDEQLSNQLKDQNII